MKSLAGFVLFVGISVVASGYPRHAFLDLPIAVPLGDAGQTYLHVELAGGKPGFAIARSIRRGIDVFATTALHCPFSLSVHALLLQDFGPLSIAVDGGSQGIRLSARLFFGPVQIDWGRTIGRKGKPWGTVSASPTQYVTLVIGVERIGGTVAFLGGARLFPPTGAWGVSLLIRQRRLTIAAGGFS